MNTLFGVMMSPVIIAPGRILTPRPAWANTERAYLKTTNKQANKITKMFREFSQYFQFLWSYFVIVIGFNTH